MSGASSRALTTCSHHNNTTNNHHALSMLRILEYCKTMHSYLEAWDAADIHARDAIRYLLIMLYM